MAQESGDNASVTDIIVTAQKREQSLQDVPIAVTAISQDALRVNRITNPLDLSAQAPNLFVRKAAGAVNIPNFAMRGSVSFGSVAGQDKAISLYLDGVYIGSSQGSAFELPDLQRIEILRGPQGTLFGRNSTAGAISIITKDPSGEFGVTQQLTFGNYDQFRSSTRVETPAFGPFSASISYTHDERTGDMKNLGAGTVWDRSGAIASPWARRGRVSPKTLGDQNSESVFVAVKFEPSDTFKTVYKFDWMENNFTPEGTGLVAFTPAPGSALAIAFAANPSPIAADGHRPDAVNNFFSVPGYQTVKGHSLTSTLEVSDGLSFKNILAYRKSFIFGAADLGAAGLYVTPAVAAALGRGSSLVGSPFVMSGSSSESRAKQWSEEFQINYNSKLLTLTAGAIYFNIDTVNGAPDNLAGSLSQTTVLGGIIPSGQRNIQFNTGKSLAGYVQAEVHVTPQLDVVGGYRLTRDKKTGTSYVYVSSALRQDVYTFSYRDTRPSYMLGVNYKPTDDILLYGKYSTGFVSGGSVSGIDFPPETVKAWEAGVKAELFDRRLRANLALFKADYKDLQAVSGGQFLTPPDPNRGTLVLREGDLATKGAELELLAVPVRGLTLGAGFGYTDSKFSNVNPRIHAPGEPETIRPKWTSNLSAQYETEPLFGDARLMFRVDGVWRSKYRALRQTTLTAAYNPVLYSDAMWVVNGRVALRDVKLGGSKAEIAAWVRNLTDSDNPAQPIYFGTFATTNYQRARTFGVDLTFDF
ncbi:MAG TPA: TonB-dependent receptor [Sphingobium sp.]|nr:TonB-dependent receptor [Sphingobium sp.]